MAIGLIVPRVSDIIQRNCQEKKGQAFELLSGSSYR